MQLWIEPGKKYPPKFRNVTKSKIGGVWEWGGNRTGGRVESFLPLLPLACWRLSPSHNSDIPPSPCLKSSIAPFYRGVKIVKDKERICQSRITACDWIWTLNSDRWFDKSLKKREHHKVKQVEQPILWKMGFSSQPWIVPRSSNLDFCTIKTNLTVISESNMLSQASLLTQSFSLLPKHLYIWLCGTSPIEFQLIPRGRAYYLAAYYYKCFINYISSVKSSNSHPDL